MQETQKKKIFCFVDESGDTVFFNRKGNDLVKSGDASPIFIVGYMEVEDHSTITKVLEKIKEDIRNDEYLQNIPSLKKSLRHFHAKDDCPEVREKIYRAIKGFDIKAFVIVARKSADMFSTKFDGKASNMYEFLVEKLFEQRLHLYSEIDIYFSKMGSTVREKNMGMALEKAKKNFYKKWGKENDSTVRIFVQEPSQITPLQVIDYILWTVQRVYTKGDMRYYDFIKEKIVLIHDIFDFKKYGKNYYKPKNPLDVNKISPLNS